MEGSSDFQNPLLWCSLYYCHYEQIDLKKQCFTVMCLSWLTDLSGPSLLFKGPFQGSFSNINISTNSKCSSRLTTLACPCQLWSIKSKDKSGIILLTVIYPIKKPRARSASVALCRGSGSGAWVVHNLWQDSQVNIKLTVYNKHDTTLQQRQENVTQRHEYNIGCSVYQNISFSSLIPVLSLQLLSNKILKLPQNIVDHYQNRFSPTNRGGF